ncbi:MAG: phosphotransferase [Erysipelotrichaceae bacterium]|nr:phosphotransferase [Erysipelotrichaceae bacterium]
MEKRIIAERTNKEIYVQDGKTYKVFEKGYNKADILNEALNTARVEETGLNIPRLFEVKSIDEEWAIVSQYIEGKTMKELMDENPDKLDELMNRFVGIQIDMQSKRVPLLNRHRDKMNRKISQTDLPSTLRYNLHNRIESMPKHTQLCHGDYNPSNVIINENDEAYIIDWAHATQGNAEADAARTFLLFLLDDDRLKAHKYLTVFCEKSGCNLQEVLNWLPILAASQSVKGIENQSRFLRKLITMDEEELRSLYD